MAAMATALGSTAAMVPAGGLYRRSIVSNKTSSGVQARAAGAKRDGWQSGVGLGRMPPRPQSARVATPGPKRSLTIVAAKAEGQIDATELQEKLEDLLKKIQDSWGKVDDKLAIGGLGFVALLGLWSSTGLLYALDKLPLIPQFLEIVGLLFTGWFVYRYVLFKPDREELLKLFDETKSKITGQDPSSGI